MLTLGHYFLHFVELLLFEVSMEAWTPLQNLQTLFYQHFPVLDRKYHQRAGYVSYQLLFCALPHNAAYLDRVMLLTLLKVCSRPPGSVEDSQRFGDDSMQRRISVKDYVPLFDLLLKSEKYKVRLPCHIVKFAKFGKMENFFPICIY